MRLSLSMGCRLEQRLVREPHAPLKNPSLTIDAQSAQGNLDDVLAVGILNPHDKMLHVEAFLLSMWGEANWKAYLDSPLIAHVGAALQLRPFYDAVVGIQKAGVPYAQILGMVGLPMFTIDYSHYKRRMEQPIMDATQLKSLRHRKSVLLTDIDFVTGRTLREVTKYLRDHDVPVRGAYIGLTAWHGINGKEFSVGEDTVNFDSLWKKGGSALNHLRTGILPRQGLLPQGLTLYTSNSHLEERPKNGSAVARTIARHFNSQHR